MNYNTSTKKERENLNNTFKQLSLSFSEISLEERNFLMKLSLNEISYWEKETLYILLKLKITPFLKYLSKEKSPKKILEEISYKRKYSFDEPRFIKMLKNLFIKSNIKTEDLMTMIIKSKLYD